MKEPGEQDSGPKIWDRNRAAASGTQVAAVPCGMDLPSYEKMPRGREQDARRRSAWQKAALLVFFCAAGSPASDSCMVPRIFIAFGLPFWKSDRRNGNL